MFWIEWFRNDSREAISDVAENDANARYAGSTQRTPGPKEDTDDWTTHSGPSGALEAPKVVEVADRTASYS
ncbi:hypothetical protein N7462_001416 [Penicillium macrosclerotiorum]|uniref:uncharacterized protein n=1 Tax=Penicillium macrosclerotiorum TaxID=303699 RepID=UPI002548443A|nr:uncharacterized protein N7462_001416 [Penicillium macrosclerotiorum]KAJ5691993.1 hypothetical protein N7462_001416 [Penicillium macrosclerotiorum]